MKTSNAFFKWQDQQTHSVGGMEIPTAWWSRSYEYAWALRYAEAGQTVADMGCGWMVRPFKSALADVCEKVYAVDADERLLSQKNTHENLSFVIADFSKPIEAIPPASLDRIFCISVLEDLGENLRSALGVFSQLLKPDGLVIATFDVQYNIHEPLGKYPGVDFQKLTFAMAYAGLEHAHNIDVSKTDAVYHKEFNLCCFHAVMRKG